jgi:D-xylose 1-dehydrogenase (NADP+, D-xylono-1,5-lactone-forming)
MGADGGRTGADDRVRWGILGIAGITRRFLPALRAAGNAELAAVATHRPAAAEPLLADWPNLRVHGDYAALLADPAVEAIYIPLPNTLHAEWTMRAVGEGKHVLCEKPLATTLADVEAMAAAAERHGRLLMEGFMWRFHPQHARVKALLADGAIGQPKLIRAGLSFPIDTSRPNIRLDPAVGGGVIWDVGCYAMSIPRFFFEAEPTTIAATARIDPALGVDLSLAALATFPGDRVALLDASMEMTRRVAYEVIGDAGSVRIQHFWIEPDAEARITIADAFGAESVEKLPPYNHFIGEIEHFSDAVRGRTALRYGPADALAQIRALAAMKRAFSSGRAEPV